MTRTFLFSIIACAVIGTSAKSSADVAARLERAEAVADRLLERGERLTAELLARAGARDLRVDRHRHGLAQHHAGLFRLYRGGLARVVKIFPFFSDWYQLRPDAVEKTLAPNSLDVPIRSGAEFAAAFRRELVGLSLAAEVGGPKIFAAGRFDDGSHRNLFFVEMEHLFPDQPSFTLKALIRQFIGGKSAHPALRLSPGQLNRAVEMITANLRHGIALGFDYDLIFSGQAAAWIDSGCWDVFRGVGAKCPVDISELPADQLASALQRSVEILTWLDAIHPWGRGLIVTAVDAGISTVSVWRPRFRREVIRQLTAPFPHVGRKTAGDCAAELRLNTGPT